LAQGLSILRRYIRRPRRFDNGSSTYLPLSAEVGARPLRAARANHVFDMNEKCIRTENMVMDKNKGGLDLSLSKIADCARMCFSSARNR
jgi:hypothetical protein